MTADKMQAISGMPNRQKATIGLMVVVVLVLAWQVMGLFGGGSSSTPSQPTKVSSAGSSGGSPMQPMMVTPKPVDIMAQKPAMTEREAELMKLQEETQAKYLQALNELQVLKVAKEIAVTNKDISSAKLSRVQSEKKIIDILAPPAPPPVAESISKQNIMPISVSTPTVDQDVSYSVVSISQLQNKWNAVLSYKGVLYNVNVGDTVPADGSVVESINKDGVTLSKDGKKRTASLVSVM